MEWQSICKRGILRFFKFNLTNIKNNLTKKQFHITQEGGTEAPFSGEYCNFFQPGLYLCICCKTPLFSSKSKYDFGSGWLDFKSSINEKVIKYIEDFSMESKRIEVKCCKCDSHLGHVFDDGPPPDYKRY